MYKQLEQRGMAVLRVNVSTLHKMKADGEAPNGLRCELCNARSQYRNRFHADW